MDALAALLSSAPLAERSVRCGGRSATSCPAFAEGCFDFSPMYCSKASVRPEAPPPPQEPPRQQAAARLWADPGAPRLGSALPEETQLCVRGVCDALAPAKASLCYCRGTAAEPQQCDPALGDAQAAAEAARALCGVRR
jgi:hypothetical protein